MARALRWLLLSLFLLLFCSCAQSFLKRGTRGDPSSTANHHRSRWFKQRLDHFSKKRSRFWLQALKELLGGTWPKAKYYQMSKLAETREGCYKGAVKAVLTHSEPMYNCQRYFLDDTFYKPGGPVFLIISGEGAATGISPSRNFTLNTYAERLGALFLLLEHRFYGQSQPTGILNHENYSPHGNWGDLFVKTTHQRDLSTASLRYLSSRQALADIANFRTEIARKRGLTKNKWVTFGGSYGGSLAVWSRIKHPNLFAAAVSSSAPIQAKLNFYEYNEVIGKILSAHNSECPKAVKEAFAILVHMLKRRKYYSKLETEFMLCEPIKINSPKDTAFLMINMIRLIDLFVREQINKFIKGEPEEINIDNLCDNMTDASLGSPYDRFTKIIHLFLKSKHVDCLSASYSDELEELSNSSLGYLRIKYERQWLYQCCTEFGFFMTTDSKNQPFSGTPLRYFLQLCSDVFGPEFSRDLVARGVKTSNRYYGGFNVNGSKIIFSNGSNDPWHRLGITKDISKDLPAVFIKGEGHCADVLEQNDTDSAELIQAREKIFQILQKWLKQ